MVYEKPIMRLSELVKMGFPEEYLMRIYRMKGQVIARKSNPLMRNSPIIFDTQALDDYWKKAK